MSDQSSFVVVIPARYGSSRLPGKPLIGLYGKPMIQRVAEQALKSDAKQVLVATDDERVAEAIVSMDVQVVMTKQEHTSGTDRVWEAIEKAALGDGEVVVNVQGDEPLIPPEVINQVAELIADDQIFEVGTLCERISERSDIFNPNVVKVVFDEDGRALYFSRAPIPWERDRFNKTETEVKLGPWFRHVGIYAYTRRVLERFVSWKPSRLELLESLEQLRLMENRVAIKVALARTEMPSGVDTAEDADRVRRYLSHE